jgi:hypothetical protein
MMSSVDMIRSMAAQFLGSTALPRARARVQLERLQVDQPPVIAADDFDPYHDVSWLAGVGLG